MKTAAIVMASLILATIMGVSSAWAGRIDNRQYRQWQRIRQKIHSGELTRWESTRLIKEQRRIRKAIRRAWADGRLTHRERNRIERMQNRAGRHIRQLKHNHRVSWH